MKPLNLVLSPNQRGVALLRNREWRTRETITAVTYARIVSCAIIFFLVFLGSVSAQTAAGSSPLITSITGPGNLVKIIPFAPVVVCGWPASGANPCTNLQQTFTDPNAGSACPSTAQVISPGTTACSSTSDSAGNFSFFVTTGSSVAYYFKYLNTWKGPFVTTIGGSGGGGGGGNVPLGATGQVPVMNPLATAYAPQTKQMVDSADAPGVVADGSTDVCTTFQAWIDANPGKHLWTRKVAAPTQGGNSYSTIDYYSSCTFHIKYNGTVIDGSNPDDWQGAPVFLFAAGVRGFQIDPVCMGCAIKNIEEVGGGKPAYSSSACYNSGHPENYPFTGASDGFYILGGEASLEHVQANCNPRDGIHVDGSNIVYGGFAGQPDLWRVIGGQGSGNLHDNLYTHGGDSNAGYERGFEAYNAGGWGIEDDTPYGNEHVLTFTNGNGRDVGSSAGATSAISSISCSSFTCSVVTATPVAGIHNNIWLMISSTTNYNGTFYITGYTDTQHFSFLNVAPSVATETSGSIGVEGSTHLFANAVRTVTDGACPSGQANLTSQSAQFGKDTQPGAIINVAGAGSGGVLLTTTISQVINEYSVNLSTNCLTTVSGTNVSYGGGISHGPMMSNAASVQNVWIEPNQEANQPPSKFTSANEVIGGLTSFDYTYGIPTIRTVNNTTIAHVAQFRDPADTGSTGGVQMQCGTSTQRNCGLSFFNYNQSAGWLIDQLGGSSNGLVFQIAENNGAGGIIPFRATHAGTTDVTASTDVTLNPGLGHAINLNVGQIVATEPTGSVWGGATGGAKGAGTINAQGLYVNNVPVTGVFTGSPWYDITAGTPCNGSADDTAVLAANVALAAGGYAYIPALKKCETTATLTLPTALQGFWIGPGAQLQATATITGHGVIEQGGIGSRSTNAEVYGGGVIDANGKADDAAWFHNFAGLRVHDITLKGSNVNGLVLGDSSASFSDNAWVHHVWIDRPGAVSIPSGSSGILMNNIGDSDSIDNNTIISYDQGITVNGTNHWFAHNHVWARLAFTEAFVDNGTGNHWEGNEADSPATYCFRLGLSQTMRRLPEIPATTTVQVQITSLSASMLPTPRRRTRFPATSFMDSLALIAWHKISRVRMVLRILRSAATKILT